MTSQKWLNDEDFAPTSQAKSIWWHILIIIVPDQIRFKNNGSIYLTGNGQGFVQWNTSEDVLLANILACSMGTITGVLFQVGNTELFQINRPPRILFSFIQFITKN